MIRPATVICALIAAGSGLFLYTKKHETLVLDQNITKIVQETRRVQEQTAMLRTQWALLNQPDRLSALSARVLPQLRQVEPTQFIQLAKLRAELPTLSQRLINMSPAHERAHMHLASLTQKTSKEDVPHPSPEEHHHTSRSHNTNEDAIPSLEQSLALLDAASDSTPVRHKHHDLDDEDWDADTSSHKEEPHTKAGGIHTISASTDDDQTPLPPPVPLAN